MTVRLAGPASICCAELIDGPEQPLRVVHRSTTAWQLADVRGRGVLCLAGPAAVRLPHAVVVPRLPVGCSVVTVGRGALRWDDTSLRVSRWWAPARPHLPRLVGRIDDGAANDLLHAWRYRLGLGPGLTPYDDDVLSASLVTLLASGHPVGPELAQAVRAHDLEAATTATSAALLRHAAAGRCIDELAGYLRARASELAGAPVSTRPWVDQATTTLLGVGHSSGVGMVDGVCALIGPSHPGNNATPRGNDATPRGNDATPRGNDATPRGNDATPRQQVGAQVGAA